MTIIGPSRGPGPFSSIPICRCATATADPYHGFCGPAGRHRRFYGKLNVIVRVTESPSCRTILP